jgi:hypothetical protein
MPTGICISIGLNEVDPKGYDGWVGKLNACENDAREIGSFAQAHGFTTKELLTANATSKNVLGEIFACSSALNLGDMLIVFYSGHGGQIGDANGDEEDKLDETWCLYDRMLIDDELYAMWAKFKPGVRILVLSDSCHSGSVTKDAWIKSLATLGKPLVFTGALATPAFKTIPFSKSWDIYTKARDTYDSLQFLSSLKSTRDISASVLLISACQDNQLAADGDPNSAFTERMLSTLKEGFKGNYHAFKEKVAAGLPPSQSPNYYLVGTVNPEFEAQQPFQL